MSDGRLTELRAEIDAVDAQLAALFERRMNIVSEVAGIKREAGLPVFDPAREADVVARGRARVSAQNADGFEIILREIMRLSKEYQHMFSVYTEINGEQ